MKTLHKTYLAALIASSLAYTGAMAETVTATSTSTTETAGTISEFSPDTIVVRSESAPEPVRYTYSKTTTYVDDAGAPVSIETVKSGLPVTVHYIRDNGHLVANRVIVHRHVTKTAPAEVEEHSTTTTTTNPPVIEHEKRSTTTTVTK